MKFDEITDWFIPEGRPRQAVVYPGPLPLPDELVIDAENIHQSAVERSGHSAEYTISHNSVFYRGHRQVTIEGVMHILRRLPAEVPELKKLGLPPQIVQILGHARFGSNGGLVLVCGEAGHGKSTTCAAAIRERVIAHGAYCLTVEDPPEFPLHGDHPAAGGKLGKIVQVPVGDGGFAHALRNALRCYPSNLRGSMLMVGEVQDPATAAHLLRAAMNGQLVFSTVHASDPLGALERLVSMAKDALGEEQARSLLGHSLRAVLHQRLSNGRLAMAHLFSRNANSPVATQIKNGNTNMLATELSQQGIQLQRNLLIEKVLDT